MSCEPNADVAKPFTFATLDSTSGVASGDLPDGQFLRFGSFGCPALWQKIFRFPRRANQIYDSPHPASIRGALAIVTNVGAGCNGRGGGARRAALIRLR
jgi:hypothetical protein